MPRSYEALMSSSCAFWRFGRWQTVSRLLVIAAAGSVAVLAAGWIASSHYATHVIAIVVAVPLLIVVARRPLLSIMLLLLAAASVFNYASLPRLGLPGNPPINIADVLLATSLAGTLWRKSWHSWPVVVRRYFWALLLTLVLASVATIKTSVLGPDQAREALYGYRNFLYLGVALTIALELSSKEWRALLDASIFLAAVISVISLAGAASTGVAHFLHGVSAQSITTSAEAASPGGTTRVRLPGLFFAYSMCILTLVAALLVRDRWRPLRAIALLLIFGAIGTSLNRDMYGGLAVGIGLAAVLGGTQIRSSIVLGTLAIIGAAILMALTSLAPFVDSGVGARASTLLTPSSVLESGSLEDRAYEYSKALPAISARPWAGVGPRQFYGAYLGQGETRTIRFFVQNVYVDFATDYGIPTALGFLLLPAICLFFGFRRLRRAAAPLDRALLAATIGTLIAMLMSCLVGTFVQDPESTVAFGAACGFLLAAGLRTYPDFARQTRSVNSSADT